MESLANEVATLAGFLPGYRAARINPTVALRVD
jgi:ABC-type lipoprotein release transport system permease subunit